MSGYPYPIPNFCLLYTSDAADDATSLSAASSAPVAVTGRRTSHDVGRDDADTVESCVACDEQYDSQFGSNSAR